jgi:hypothetical protein
MEIAALADVEIGGVSFQVCTVSRQRLIKYYDYYSDFESITVFFCVHHSGFLYDTLLHTRAEPIIRIAEFYRVHHFDGRMLDSKR